MSRGTWESDRRSPFSFRLLDYHHLWSAFPGRFNYEKGFLTPVPSPRLGKTRPRYTNNTTPAGFIPLAREHVDWFRLFRFRSPLLSESLLISVPRDTEMFHFSRLAFPPCGGDALSFNRTGCPIRVSPDQRLFAPLRRFSQPTTPFIAFRCRGILRTPLVS